MDTIQTTDDEPIYQQLESLAHGAIQQRSSTIPIRIERGLTPSQRPAVFLVHPDWWIREILIDRCLVPGFDARLSGPDRVMVSPEPGASRGHSA